MSYAEAYRYTLLAGLGLALLWTLASLPSGRWLDWRESLLGFAFLAFVAGVAAFLAGVVALVALLVWWVA